MDIIFALRWDKSEREVASSKPTNGLITSAFIEMKKHWTSTTKTTVVKSDNKSLHNCYNVLRANHEDSFPVLKEKLNNHFNSGRSPITETSESNKTIVISYFFNQGRPSKRFDIRVRFKRSGLIAITVMSRVAYSFVLFDSLSNNGGWKSGLNPRVRIKAKDKH